MNELKAVDVDEQPSSLFKNDSTNPEDQEEPKTVQLGLTLVPELMPETPREMDAEIKDELSSVMDDDTVPAVDLDNEGMDQGESNIQQANVNIDSFGGSSFFGTPSAPKNTINPMFQISSPLIQSTATATTPGQVFGAASKPAFGGFQSPSASPTPPTAFVQPAFGAASVPQSGFGAFGSSGTSSVFGQPSSGSQFGQNTSAFGRPAFGGATTAAPSFASFAGASGMQPTSQPFGSSEAKSAVSSFGSSQSPMSTTTTAPAFGAATNMTPAFGAPSFPNISNTSTVFGQSSFGGASANAPKFSNISGGSVGFGSFATNGGGFASVASQGQPVFGSQQQPSNTSTVFGTPSGGPAMGASGFGSFANSNQQNNDSSVFGGSNVPKNNNSAFSQYR